MVLSLPILIHAFGIVVAAAARAGCANSDSGSATASTSPPLAAADAFRNSRRDVSVGELMSYPLLPAALWMAARIRGYVPQRQMLPCMAWSMSASVGFGFARSNAVAAMIWPAWQ